MKFFDNLLKGVIYGLIGGIVALSFSHRACGAEVSFVPEVGYVKMASAPDDFWYEQALPHNTDFDTLAFGASLRLDVGHVQLSVGWRSLGTEHQTAYIIDDQTFFHCRAKPRTCPAPSQWWTEDGGEAQTYAQLGYAFRLPASWRLVPTLGVADTRVTSQSSWYTYPALKLETTGKYTCQAPAQRRLAPFYGVTLQRGGFGVGVDLLNTEPDRSANNCTSPIQGSSALYLHVSYAFNL